MKKEWNVFKKIGNCWSRVVPKFFWYFVVGSVSLFNLSDRVVSYSAGSGVKNVVVVLPEFI